MDGTVELRQLANLFRIGAETATNIGTLRPSDAEAIKTIADEAVALAARLDALAVHRNGASNGAS